VLHQLLLLKKPKLAAASSHILTLDKFPYLGQPQKLYLRVRMRCLNN
jgi:hypothetical protein